MRFDERQGFVIETPPVKHTYAWGYDRKVIGQLVEVADDWDAYRYLKSFDPERVGRAAPMPKYRRVRLILDVPPKASGFCSTCDQPIVTLRCAWPSLDGYEQRVVRLNVDPETLEGYHSEHELTVHAADHSTHGAGSLLPRSTCTRCGGHARDQFRLVQHAWHDEVTCRTCGARSTHSIGD